MADLADDISDATRGEPLRSGASFRWTTFGMTITSTVYAVDEGSRILWGGSTGDITGIHEWTFTDTPNGVEVTTTESFSGPAVTADPATMQTLLDQSLTSWLEQLKTTAESKV